MKITEKQLNIAWLCLGVICAGLGFFRGAEGFGKILLVATSVIFFIPGFYLLWLGYKTKNARIIRRIRMLSLFSILATIVLFIALVASIFGPLWLGDIIYILFVVCSTPMLCAQYWVLSLFLWSCLLVLSFKNPAR